MNKYKFLNYDGKPVEFSGDRTYIDLHFSDLALLVFYYNLLVKGTIEIGGAGFERFTQLKARVYRKEQEQIKDNPAILKNTKRRRYIQKLLRAGTEFQDTTTSNN